MELNQKLKNYKDEIKKLKEKIRSQNLEIEEAIQQLIVKIFDSIFGIKFYFNISSFTIKKKKIQSYYLMVKKIIFFLNLISFFLLEKNENVPKKSLLPKSNFLISEKCNIFF